MLNIVCRRFIRQFRFSIHNYNKPIEPQSKLRIHGRLLVDEFYHLKDKPLNKLQNFQNKNYQKHADKWKDGTDGYWNTYNQRRDPRVDSPPELYDKYEYYCRASWIQERQYQIMYRRPVGGDYSTQQLVLDYMSIPQVKKYRKTADLVKTALNPSHTLMCFAVDLHNNQNLYFYIRDLAKKKVFQQKFQGQVKNVTFCDDESLYYIIEGNDKRGCKLYYKKIGDQKGQLLHEQTDSEYHLDFQKSKDGTCLILSSSNRTTNQIYTVIKTKDGKFQMKKYLSKQEQSRGFMNKSGKIYLWTDKDSYDFRIKVWDQQKEQFIDFYEPEQGVTITEVDMFDAYIVLYLRSNSKSTVRVLEINTKNAHDIDLKEDVCMITPGLNQGYNARKFVFFVNTPFIYNESYSYDINTKTLVQLSHFKLTGPKFDRKKYKSSVVFAPSETGDLIPISIVQKANRKGPAKMLLKVYGFYGLENEVQFGNVYLGALENDWIIAYAHVRGGNELGNRWWKSAILSNKPRAWKDLKECVGYLFAHQYTHPSLLVLQGSSAGAITVWNAINHNPYLYKAAILSFPFLDVLNSLLDSELALSGIDYSEFGNPNESLETFNTIQSYCPYQTIKSQQYPAIFIQAGKNDYRCPLYQVLKFAQRFRHRAKPLTKIDEIGDKGLIVSIRQQAGHMGQSDGKEQARQECQVFGYLDYILLEANKDLTYQ